MLTFPDFIELLEARKNADQNQKISPFQRIKDLLDKAKPMPNGSPNLFVSFTKVEKLGINPGSRFVTPLGIYCYPADYVVKMTENEGGDMSQLPFAGDSPFVNVFSVKGEIIELKNMPKGRMKVLFDRLKKLYPESKNIDKWIAEAPRKAKMSGAGPEFYYVTENLAKELSNNNSDKTTVRWNGIFRKLGVSAVVDSTDKGIIHPGEPTQCCVLQITDIVNNQRFDNKWSDKSKEDGDGAESRNDKNRSLINSFDDSKKLGILKMKPELLKYLSADWEPKFIDKILVNFDSQKVRKLILDGIVFKDESIDALVKTDTETVLSYFKQYLYALERGEIKGRKLGNKSLQKIVDFIVEADDAEDYSDEIDEISTLLTTLKILYKLDRMKELTSS